MLKASTLSRDQQVHLVRVCSSSLLLSPKVLFMAMPLSVLGNAMSQTWADRHRIVLITQTRQKLKNLGYTAEHMPKLFPDVNLFQRSIDFR